jgi:hypothetical protein
MQIAYKAKKSKEEVTGMVGRMVFDDPKRQKLYERIYTDYKRLFGKDFDEFLLNTPDGKKYRHLFESRMRKKE